MAAHYYTAIIMRCRRDRPTTHPHVYNLGLISQNERTQKPRRSSYILVCIHLCDLVYILKYGVKGNGDLFGQLDARMGHV